MFQKMKTTYNEFPKVFWILSLSAFIDSIGNFMLMPFISMYMRDTFEISMVEVGLAFTIVAVGSLLGGMLGGVMTDKFGRKKMALYGLLISGLFSIIFIFIEQLVTLYIVIGIMGLVGSLGGPARGAMLADILPPKQRAEGYGIFRVAFNLSATIGPAIGGFLATKNFSYLFIGDAISSVIVAIIFIVMIPETKPKADEDMPTNPEEVQKGGYLHVFLDWKFMTFVGISILMNFVYMQLNSTLPVYIRDTLGISSQIYGLMISMNGFMVVIFQFWITRKIKKFPALIMIAVGNIFYGVGFGMFGLIETVPFLFMATVIITIGEMVIAPFAQAVAANMAPEDKRGRYLAIHNMSGLFPTMFGILLSGVIMDSLGPQWLWYITGMVSVITVFGYLLLSKTASDRFRDKSGDGHELEEISFFEIEGESRMEPKAPKSTLVSVSDGD